MHDATGGMHAHGPVADDTTVLMYHAIVDDGGSDRYALPVAAFTRQVDRLVATGTPVRAFADCLAANQGGVCITFDDGHASHAAAALDILAPRGVTADFFVTASRVGTPGFVTWPQLRAMAAAGMSIQSHGLTHRYFDTFGPRELERELAGSRAALEDGLGAPVSLYAPPYGCLTGRIRHAARSAGYRHILSSRPGRVAFTRRGFEIPRLAVGARTPDGEIDAWLAGDATTLRHARLRHALAGVAKRALGGQRYHDLRARLAGGNAAYQEH
jgi:peptidoglycan/xylan/chitin deacetylase (PgdA/CDA1 family)